MISYCNKKPFLHPSQYVSGYRFVDTKDMHRIAKCISMFAWTPAKLAYDHRSEKNFDGADLAVLDFDNPVGEPSTSIEQAVDNLFCDVKHVIATTKSHRVKSKKNPNAADRFRVVIPLSEIVRDVRSYRYQLYHLNRHFDGADSQCIDACRYFDPCTTVISVNDDGYCQDVLEVPDNFEKIDNAYVATHAKAGLWTTRMIRLLTKEKFPRNHYNNFIFGLSKDLYLYGNTQEDVFDLIINSPTYRDHKEEVLNNNRLVKEIKQAIKSGFKSMHGGVNG